MNVRNAHVDQGSERLRLEQETLSNCFRCSLRRSTYGAGPQLLRALWPRREVAESRSGLGMFFAVTLIGVRTSFLTMWVRLAHSCHVKGTRESLAANPSRPKQVPLWLFSPSSGHFRCLAEAHRAGSGKASGGVGLWPPGLPGKKSAMLRFFTCDATPQHVPRPVVVLNSVLNLSSAPSPVHPLQPHARFQWSLLHSERLRRLLPNCGDGVDLNRDASPKSWRPKGF